MNLHQFKVQPCHECCQFIKFMLQKDICSTCLQGLVTSNIVQFKTRTNLGTTIHKNAAI